MRIRGSKLAGAVCAVLIAAASFFAVSASAQQITYYDFDVPQAASDFSYACTNPSLNGPPVTNPLFCFNDRLRPQTPTDPRFLSDIYPASIDPTTTNPHTAIETTAATSYQGDSVWFSVPQKVSNGFTSYFAFKLTPNANSYATADGIAFVIQNAAGGHSGPPDNPACFETGAGPNVVGGGGGCIGYGGIDNSLAIEFDTFRNSWDPIDINATTANDNHVAVQNCGAGLPNSPVHSACLVSLGAGDTSIKAINSVLSGILADGNVHQIVVNYSGPTETIPNLLQIFVDPAFQPGTHTPVAGSIPVISGTYDIAANLNLMSSGTVNDSAYVGFTSSTGKAFEQSELLAWTFTPHTSSTQQQPIAPPGTPTTFPFGAHTFAVTYPPGFGDTSNIDMVVTANIVSPTLFAQLIAGTPFAGSICQVYDETGGNCVVYSVSCVNHTTQMFVPCPTSSDPNAKVGIKSAYNNTVQPLAPGFLQGDPFYSQIQSITGNGSTATVTCVGECSVYPGQKVTIAGGTPGTFNGPVTVLSANVSTPNFFTFASGATGTTTGGYVTSSNEQNVFTGYTAQKIDGTTTGRTKNFSDFVVTAATPLATKLVISAPPVAFPSNSLVTVTASSPNGAPTGPVSLVVDGGAPITQTLSNGSTTFSIPGLGIGNHTLKATYGAQGVFLGGTVSGIAVVKYGYIVFTPQSANFGNVGVGVTTAPIAVTVTNGTQYPAHYVMAAALGKFNFSPGTCGSLDPSQILLPAASCTIYVTFSPTQMGLIVGSFTVTTINDTVTFQLKGNGVAPTVVFTPPIANFGNVPVNTVSNPITVMVGNYSGSPATFASFSNLNDFSFQGGTCGALGMGSQLAPGQICNFQIVFSPPVAGPVNGSFTINTSAGPVLYRLTGTGIHQP